MAGTQDFSAFELTKPLSVLFQKSLDTVELSTQADVVPVSKKGDHKLNIGQL